MLQGQLIRATFADSSIVVFLSNIKYLIRHRNSGDGLAKTRCLPWTIGLPLPVLRRLGVARSADGGARLREQRGGAGAVSQDVVGRRRPVHAGWTVRARGARTARAQRYSDPHRTDCQPRARGW